VILRNANVTDLLQYYNMVCFTDAYGVGTVTGQGQTPLSAEMPIKPRANAGEYEADGTVVWLHEGPTWVYLLPTGSGGLLIVNAVDVQRGDPALQIASVSDTLSVGNTVIEHILTWVLVGFSVLMLQPIFEALLVKENAPQQQAQAKPQGTWHQHKLWRKLRSRQPLAT